MTAHIHMTQHTFRDGITRPAHQHLNGGGWVADTASVSDAAYIGPDAEVIGGTIYGGTIWDGTIYGGTIRGGTIWGGTIEGGTIRGGTIEGGIVTRSPIHITGFAYPVTITDSHMGIGCEWLTHDKWREQGATIAAEENQPPELLALALALMEAHAKGGV